MQDFFCIYNSILLLSRSQNMENKKSKLNILETDNSLTIDIPPAGFSNYLTTVFLLINGIVFVFVAIGVAAAFYANVYFKIAMIIILASGFKIARINIDFFKEMLFNTTQLSVNFQLVHITRSRERNSNNFLSIPIEEITAIRLLKSHTDSPDVSAQLFFVTKDREYSLSRYTTSYFTNEEITSIANKISDRIEKNIIT